MVMQCHLLYLETRAEAQRTRTHRGWAGLLVFMKYLQMCRNGSWFQLILPCQVKPLAVVDAVRVHREDRNLVALVKLGLFLPQPLPSSFVAQTTATRHAVSTHESLPKCFQGAAVAVVSESGSYLTPDCLRPDLPIARYMESGGSPVPDQGSEWHVDISTCRPTATMGTTSTLGY